MLVDIRVSLADPDDAEAIGDVRCKTWLATYPNASAGITVEDILPFAADSPESIDRRRQDLANLKCDWRTWVAKVDGVIVGFAVANRTGENRRVQLMYVLPDFQGHGVGTKLMSAVLDYLAADEVRLNVASYNEKAIAFYERQGFVASGKVSETALPNGKVIPEMEMVRRSSHRI